MAKFILNLQGKEAEVDVALQGQVLHVDLEGQTAELKLIHRDGAAFIVEWLQPDGSRKRIRAAGHVNGDRRQLWVNGHTFNYERVRQRGGGAGVDSSLTSSIPAVVAEVLVETGDTVQAGDKLILLESMKMVIPITAPYNGTVVALHCEAGESVQAGIPLVEVEEA